MHEVKRPFRKRVGQQVVAAHLDLIGRQRLEETGVEIDRKHRTRAADAFAKHPCDRASAGPDVQTAPALADANRVQLADSQGVVLVLEQPQTRPLEVR